MSQADKIFRKAFASHFTNHTANFPPSQPIELGDFGEIKNNYFRKLGNIKSVFGIEFEEIPDNDPTNEEFKSEGSVSVNFTAKGDIGPAGVPAAKASLNLGFDNAKSLFFNSSDVRYLAIKDLLLVGDKLLELYHQGKWSKKYVLVSTILKASRVVLVISGDSNAGITIEAQSESVPKISLTDLGVKLEIKSSSKVAYQIIADENLVIGFALSRVYNRIFQDPIFKNHGLLSNQTAMLDFRSNDAEEVVFGNIAPLVDDDIA